MLWALEDESNDPQDSEDEEDTHENLPLSKENEAEISLDIVDFITKNQIPFSLTDPLLSFVDPRLVERAHRSTNTPTKMLKIVLDQHQKKTCLI